jgi:hypothetical protein
MLRSPTTVFSVARRWAQCSVGAITRYCWSATPGRAVRRTWFHAARLGPADTSYHETIQSPGTFTGMLSCQRPPRYHAGSFGVRRIIAPPVGTGMESAKIPRGPSTALRMSCTGRCRRACAQSTGGIWGARSNRRDARIRSSRGVSGGNIGRTWFCCPCSHAMKSICTAPPRYQLPCS